MSDLGHVWSRRISRRSALRGTAVGAAGIAGAALIGCSSSEESTPTAAPTSAGGGGGTAAATATSAATPEGGPRKGGTLKLDTSVDPDTLDVLSAASYQTSIPTAFVYSRLVWYDVGDGGLAPGSVSGDAAENWEQPDELTFNFKLRDNVVYDDRAPTNGRKMTSEDVVKSWEKFTQVSAYRKDLDNAQNPAAPVASVSAIDDRTVQFKLAQPDAAFLPVLAFPFDLWIHPIESMNGGFDPNKDVRGSGPFVMKEFSPSVGRKYTRNPKWHFGPDRPYVDEVWETIIPDAAQSEAQFKAGNLHYGGVSIPNIPLVVKEVKGTHVVAAGPSAGGSAISFANDTPIGKDARLRQAISMLIDRDTYIDINYEPDALESVGASVNRYWNTPLSAGFGAYWLNPKGGSFGDGAKYLEHNVAEATKLLEAAGYSKSSPLEFTLIYTPQYGATTWPTQAEQFQAMLADGPVKMTIYSSDYSTDWIPNYLRAKGDYQAPGNPPNSAARHPHGTRADPGQWLEVFYHSRGANNVVGNAWPDLDDMIDKSRRVFDFEERVSQIQDIQRYMVENMISVPTGMVIDTVSIAYEALHGPERYQVWGGGHLNYQGGAETIPLWWMEESLS